MIFFGRDTSAKLKALDRSQAVIEFKLDGRIITADTVFLSAVGYTPDEIRGQLHRMFVDPLEREGAAYKGFRE